MDIGTFRGITTLLILIAFLGVVFWAYSKRRRKDFDEAKNLPFADEDEPSHRAPNDSDPQHSTHSRHASNDSKGDKNS